MTINTEHWQITDALTDTVITAPRFVRFSPYVTKRLAKIMAGVYTVDMFVVHTHEYIFSEHLVNHNLISRRIPICRTWSSTYSLALFLSPLPSYYYFVFCVVLVFSYIIHRMLF